MLISPHADSLGQAYSMHTQTTDPGQAERFRQLIHAVRDGRQLELLYWTASRDETNRRVVDPNHLAAIDGDWFLVGYCHLREEERMFAPSRIRELRETGEHCERPDDFHIANFLEPSFRKMRGTGPANEVRLRFSPLAARYIREKNWHPTQQLDNQPDGGLVLTLRVNHLLEVKRWALSWGADCEVLRPQELRAEIAAELGKMLATLDQKPQALSTE
jgi:predicted DNA-binding transcriptional regulator YafY